MGLFYREIMSHEFLPNLIITLESNLIVQIVDQATLSDTMSPRKKKLKQVI